MNSKIEIEQVIHKGSPFEGYVPYLEVNGVWKPLFKKGCYILRYSVKDGKITGVDNKYMVENIISQNIENLEKVKHLL